MKCAGPHFFFPTISMATILRIIFAHISVHLCSLVSQQTRQPKQVANKVAETKNEGVNLDDS